MTFGTTEPDVEEAPTESYAPRFGCQPRIGLIALGMVALATPRVFAAPPDNTSFAGGGDVEVYDVFPCDTGNGVIDVDDILGMLNAFGGNYACSCPGDELWAANGSDIYNTNTALVGISLTEPQHKLHVKGNAIAVEDYGSPSNVIGIRANGSFDAPSAIVQGNVISRFAARGYGTSEFSAMNDASVDVLAAENWTNSAHGTHVRLLTTPNGMTTSSERMRVTEAGDVGIGTTNPASKLSVNGVVQSMTGGFRFPDDTIQSTAAIPAGLASDSRLDVVSPGTDTLLAQRTLTAPAPGFVVAFATVEIEHLFLASTSSDDLASGTFRIDGPGGAQSFDFPDAFFLATSSANWSVSRTVSMHSVFSVGSGANTFTLRATSGDWQSIAERRLTLLYFPTSYGLVDVP